MSVKWKRAEEGFVFSHCGRWKITPEYWGRVTPQSYALHFQDKRLYSHHDTQKSAKAEADRLEAEDPDKYGPT